MKPGWYPKHGDHSLNYILYCKLTATILEPNLDRSSEQALSSNDTAASLLRTLRPAPTIAVHEEAKNINLRAKVLKGCP